MPGRRDQTGSAVDAQLEAYSRDQIPSRQEVLELGRLVQAWQEALRQGRSLDDPSFQKLARSGRRARDRLVRGNMRLAVTVAKSHQGRGVPLQDLIQEGGIGLVKAAEKFDPCRGYTFSTYAFWWIRQAILKALHESAHIIRVPADTGDDLARLRRFLSTCQHKPSTDEIIENSGLRDERCLNRVSAAAQARSCRSLSGLISGSEKLTLEETIACPSQGPEQQEEMLELELLRDRLHAMLGLMPTQQREAIICRHLMNMTVTETAQALQIPRNRVTPLVESSLKRLKSLVEMLAPLGILQQEDNSSKSIQEFLLMSEDASQQFVDLPLFAHAARDGMCP
jgi:RNA polymerase primary sigma factor